MIGNIASFPDEFVVHGKHISNQYADLYDSDWNLNRTVTKSPVKNGVKYVWIWMDICQVIGKRIRQPYL